MVSHIPSVLGCWPNDLMSAMTTCLTQGYFIHFINFASVAHAAFCSCVCEYILALSMRATPLLDNTISLNNWNSKLKIRLSGDIYLCYQFNYCLCQPESTFSQAVLTYYSEVEFVLLAVTDISDNSFANTPIKVQKIIRTKNNYKSVQVIAQNDHS